MNIESFILVPQDIEMLLSYFIPREATEVEKQYINRYMQTRLIYSITQSKKNKWPLRIFGLLFILFGLFILFFFKDEYFCLPLRKDFFEYLISIGSLLYGGWYFLYASSKIDAGVRNLENAIKYYETGNYTVADCLVQNVERIYKGNKITVENIKHEKIPITFDVPINGYDLQIGETVLLVYKKEEEKPPMGSYFFLVSNFMLTDYLNSLH